MTTLKEKSEKLSLRPFVCPHCQGVLGNTTDNILYLGAAKKVKVDTFFCGYCDKQVRWSPIDESFHKNK